MPGTAPERPGRRSRPGTAGAASSGEGSSTEDQARSRALRLLGRREKSRRGLDQILHRAGFSRTVRTSVLDQLESAGLVDDRRFCRLWLSAQCRLRPRSPRLLRRDLLREGIAAEVVDAVFREMSDQISDPVLAEAAARRKHRAAGSDPEKMRRWLAARGFGRRVVEDAMRAAGVETDDVAATGEEP